MAQSGYTPILIYASGTATNVPLAANLTSSASGAELALNYADGKLFYKNSSGVVTLLASTAGASGDVVGPSSATDNALARFDTTTGKLIQNSVGILSDAGVLTGLTGLTSSGSITFSSLTSGRVTYAGASGLLQDSANMTFNGTKLTVAGFLDSALTSGRVPYATTSGELTDSANLLYSGTDLTVYGITVGRGAGSVSTNTAVGASALQANTTGLSNTALGYYTLYSNTTGNYNIAVGGNNAQPALYSNTTGSSNTALGSSALYSNTTASNNTAVGYQSLYSNVTGGQNAAFGQGALYSNTASENTAFGRQAGYNNTSGTANVFMGLNAAYGNTTGSYNTALGYTALASNTTASANTAVGYAALDANTTGARNTAVGDNALGAVTTGDNNVGVGRSAGLALTTGVNNTFVGAYNGSTGGSGEAITTGSKNTILGSYNGNQGGLDIRTSSNNIVLSDGDGGVPIWYQQTSGYTEKRARFNAGVCSYSSYLSAYSLSQAITYTSTTANSSQTVAMSTTLPYQKTIPFVFYSSFNLDGASSYMVTGYVVNNYYSPTVAVVSTINGNIPSNLVTGVSFSFTGTYDARYLNITVTTGGGYSPSNIPATIYFGATMN